MSNPTDFRPVEAVVANFLTGFANDRAGFVARNVFMNRQAAITGTIQALTRGVMTDSTGESSKTVSAGELRHAPVSFNPVTYECAKYRHSTEVRGGAIAMVDQQQGVTGSQLVSLSDRMVMEKHLLEEEAAADTLLATTANWNTNSATLAGNNVWTDPASNPIEQLLDYILTLDGSEFHITLGARSWQALMTNDKLKSGMGFAIDTPVVASDDVLKVIARNLTIRLGGGKRVTKVNVSTAVKTTAGGASSFVLRDLCFINSVGMAQVLGGGVSVTNAPAVRLWSPISSLESGPDSRRAGEWTYERWYDNDAGQWRLRASRRYVYKVLGEAPYSGLVLLNCNGNY